MVYLISLTLGLCHHYFTCRSAVRLHFSCQFFCPELYIFFQIQLPVMYILFFVTFSFCTGLLNQLTLSQLSKHWSFWYHSNSNPVEILLKIDIFKDIEIMRIINWITNKIQFCLFDSSLMNMAYHQIFGCYLNLFNFGCKNNI